MPLSSILAGLQLQWTLATTSTGFSPAIQNGSIPYQWTGINAAVTNQLYASVLKIPPATTVNIVLSNYTNLVNETVNLAHVVAIALVPTGAGVTVGPSATHGLQWMWDDITATTKINPGGSFSWFDAANATGTAVTSGVADQIAITNVVALSTAWNSSTNYTIGVKASHAGNNFLCIAANTNQVPPNSTYWQEVDLATVQVGIVGSTS